MSRICEQTRERYRAWCGRRLDEHDLVYCFLDAIYLKLRPDDEPAEGVLYAWGMTLEGQKVLGARTSSLECCGHFASLEKPEAVAELIAEVV